MRYLRFALPALLAAAALWSATTSSSSTQTQAAPVETSALPEKPSPEIWARVEDSLIGSGLNKERLVRAHSEVDELGRYHPMSGSELSVRLGQLSADQLETVQSLAAQHRATLTALATNAMNELEIALAKAIDRGVVKVVRSQPNTESAEQARERAAEQRSSVAYSTSFGVDGWSVSVVLESKDCPELADALHALAQARFARDADIQRWLADA